MGSNNKNKSEAVSFLLLMAEILHQLRLVVYPIIYRVLYTSQVVQDFSQQQYEFIVPWQVPRLEKTMALRKSFLAPPPRLRLTANPAGEKPTKIQGKTGGLRPKKQAFSYKILGPDTDSKCKYHVDLHLLAFRPQGPRRTAISVVTCPWETPVNPWSWSKARRVFRSSSRCKPRRLEKRRKVRSHFSSLGHFLAGCGSFRTLEASSSWIMPINPSFSDFNTKVQ